MLESGYAPYVTGHILDLAVTFESLGSAVIGHVLCDPVYLETYLRLAWVKNFFPFRDDSFAARSFWFASLVFSVAIHR